MKKTNDQLCDEILDAMGPDARARGAENILRSVIEKPFFLW